MIGPGRGRSRSERARAASAEVVAAIIALRAAGAKQTVIATKLGVSQAHVSKVLARETRPEATQ